MPVPSAGDCRIQTLFLLAELIFRVASHFSCTERRGLSELKERLLKNAQDWMKKSEQQPPAQK